VAQHYRCHAAGLDRPKTGMSLDPEREPITRPVFVWRKIVVQLTVHGDSRPGRTPGSWLSPAVPLGWGAHYAATARSW
jgi:hypothetical protein